MCRFNAHPLQCTYFMYRDYSKSKTHTALGPYGRASPRTKGPP